MSNSKGMTIKWLVSIARSSMLGECCFGSHFLVEQVLLTSWAAILTGEPDDVVSTRAFYLLPASRFITTPLLIMDLLLTAGLPWSTIIWTVFLDWVMIITGLVGALVRTRYK